MNKKKGTSYQWILLPVLFSSASVIAGGFGGVGHTTNKPSAADQAAALTEIEGDFLDDAYETGSARMNYIGGDTRIGVGVDTEFKGRIEGSHIFMQSDDAVTSGEGWVGINPAADDEEDEEILTGAGAKVNHHWVTRDESGNPLHVNKVFGAYDQNEAKDKKVSAGYGQERENLFWSGHVSKGLSDKRDSGHKHGDHIIYEKAYDLGVGGRVGTFVDDHLLRIQGGFDYEWGTDQADSEDTPAQLTVSGGAEKFFYDSPHSIGANVELSRESGGYAGDEHDVDVRGNLSYRYDFGSAGLFASDEQYRRVRVEIPGKTEVVKVKKKRPPKVERKLVKHTMELEADTFFKVGDHHLTHAAQQRLRTMMARIRETGHHGNIRIVGNTCDVGSVADNQGLSERRAASVKRFMIANGFKPNELLAIGYGETRPKYPNTDATRHKNRRVDIEYVAYQTNYKDKVVQQGYDIEEKVRVISEPRVVWRRELIPSPPSWVGQALRNNIQYKQRIDTYRTLGSDYMKPDDDSDVKNTRPVAVNDESNTVGLGESVDINVLVNDSDADGDTLMVIAESLPVETPAGGQVELLANGQIRYIAPAETQATTDSFMYTIKDGQGGTATATVTITLTGSGNATKGVNAVDDHVSTELNQTVSIAVLENDSDPDEGTISVSDFESTSTEGGTVTVNNGVLIYEPPQDFVGEDSFTYTVIDSDGETATATVTVTVTDKSTGGVTAVDDSVSTDFEQAVSINVLENDSDPDGGTISISGFDASSVEGGSITQTDGLLVYTPPSGFTGTDTFAYTIIDTDGETASATVTVHVDEASGGGLKAVDDGAQGEQPGDAYSFYANDTVTRNLDVLANDMGDGLEIIAIVEKPRFGTAQIAADGLSVNYTLRSGYCEDHYFVYRVRDKYGNEADARVYINILDDGKNDEVKDESWSDESSAAKTDAFFGIGELLGFSSND